MIPTKVRQEYVELHKTRRAVKPESYEEYGVEDGVWISDQGDSVNIEEFYCTIVELGLGLLMERASIVAKPRNKRSDARLKTILLQLRFLLMATSGELEELIFPISQLKESLSALVHEELEDFVNSFGEYWINIGKEAIKTASSYVKWLDDPILGNLFADNLLAHPL